MNIEDKLDRIETQIKATHRLLVVLARYQIEGPQVKIASELPPDLEFVESSENISSKPRSKSNPDLEDGDQSSQDKPQ